MRIIVLTAGTGSFHCGTCMRDNALVVELRREGHDAVLVPMYLPLVLDEPQATTGTPLFYGGINVYLQQKSALFRHTPRWLDRWFDSASALKTAAGRAGMTTASELGEITLSMLRGEGGHQAKELERLKEWLAAEGKADVVLLSNALLLGVAPGVRAATGAPIACFLNGEDTYLDSLPEGDRLEAWRALAELSRQVEAFLPVSRYYGELMRARADLQPERLHVVHPGIVLDGYGPPERPPDPPVLGYLARMYPGEGLETLVEAYLLLRSRDRVKGLRLRVGGSMNAADEPFAARMKGRLAQKGFAADTRFCPNLTREEKIRFLQGLSVFSVPATYGESFGLYVIEALAAGVPVVQPRHAAFPELLEETGGGVLCEPADPLSLAERVEELLSDPQAARAMGARGEQAVRERFGVETMARETLRVLGSIRPAAARL